MTSRPHNRSPRARGRRDVLLASLVVAAAVAAGGCAAGPLVPSAGRGAGSPSAGFGAGAPSAPGGSGLVVAAIAPPAATLPAPIASGVVTGRIVTYRDGAFRAVDGARVVAPDGAAATTDAEGRYALPGVAPGPHALTITHAAHPAARLEVVVLPGRGTPRANAVLQAPRYALRQAAAFDLGVTGVVSDPRGAALGGATVTLSCARAHGGAGATVTTVADGDGFFAASLRNVLPAPAPAAAPTLVYAASGTTPGGVAVRTEAPIVLPVATPDVALNVQALAFDDLPAPEIAGTAFVAGGQTGSIALPNLSARADEYYLEIVSGAERYDALPFNVLAGQASFRAPATLPDALYALRVVPFGRTARRTAASPDFVAVYTQADLAQDVTFDAPTWTDVGVAANTIVADAFLAGEQARYVVTFRNANARIAPELMLTGTIAPGTTAVEATTDKGSAAVIGPDAAGAFQVIGLKVPTSGTLTLQLLMKASATAANGLAFGFTSVAVAMPAAGIVAPAAPVAPPALTVAGVDTAAFTLAKVVQDDGAAGDGKAKVVLTLTPAGSLAGAAYKLTDATKTEVASSATAALFTGTATLPPAGTSLGLTTSDVLDLKVDGGAALQVKVFGAAYDAETLIGQINAASGLAGLVKASRTAGKFALERVDQGAGKTLEVLATPASANLRAVLGLPVGLRKGGFQADFAAATATQPNGTTWTVVPTNVAWAAATGSASATIALRPPASFKPGDGPASPITLTYALTKLNGAAAAYGGGAGATFGPKTVSYNLVSPYTGAANDRAFVRTAADAAAVTGF